MSTRDVLNLSFEPACLADSSGRLLHVNEAFVDMFGCCASSAECRALADVLGQTGADQLLGGSGAGPRLLKRLMARTAGGDPLALEARSMRLPGGDTAIFLRPRVGFAGADDAEHMALHDALTGLPNRVLLLDRMRLILARVTRHNDFAAVLFIDLDGFKPVNDTYGHDCGDHVLRTVATRLREAGRGADTAARIGGDEFVMVLGELRNGLHAGLTANRVIKSITQPIPWKAGSVSVSASLGIAVAPTDGMVPEELLRLSDEAMYVAKKSGKNGYSFANESSYFE